MKNVINVKSISHIIKPLIFVFSIFFSLANNVSAMEYTLTSDDVVVNNGIIDSCSYNFTIKEIIIPDSLDGQEVVGIGVMTFEAKEITKITLPLSIKYIRRFAFAKNNITSLDLSPCKRLVLIDEYAFYANNLTVVNLTGCNSLSYLGKNVFLMTQLDNITLPEHKFYSEDGWMDLMGNVFSAGTTVSNFMTSYYIPTPYTLTSNDVMIKNGIIQSCSYDFRYKVIVIPSVLNNQTVIGIKDNTNSSSSVFNSYQDSLFCKRGIINITLPETLESIGENSFAYNDLQALNIDDCNLLIHIGANAFNNNPLTTIRLPDNPEYVSYGWRNELNDYIEGGSSISNFSSYYYVPQGYLIISKEEAVIDRGVLIGCNYDTTFKEIRIPEIIDNQTITSIGNDVFSGKGLERIILPSTLNLIKEGAFSSNNLTKVDLSNCVELSFIDSKAFDNNPIADFVLPFKTKYGLYNWRSGDKDTFRPEDNVTNFSTYYYLLAPYTILDEDVEVQNGVIQSCSYDFALKTIIIPDSLDGQRIIGFPNGYLSEGLFASKNIVSVQLPSGIETIGRCVFYENLLDSLNLDHCTELRFIKKDAFSKNSNLCLKLPVNNEYPEYGWKNSMNNNFKGGDIVSDLSQAYYVYAPYTLKDGDVIIENGIIQSCSANLRYLSLVIPDSLNNQEVTGVKDAEQNSTGVFAGKGILDVQFPASLKMIGNFAFSSNNIININFKELISLEFIGNSAFYSNYFVNIYLNDCKSLVYIGNKAFDSYQFPTFKLPTPEIVGFDFYRWWGPRGKYLGGAEVYTADGPYIADDNVSIDEVKKENFNIYPNPSSDNFTISYLLERASKVTINLYDLNGVKINSFKLGNKSQGNHLYNLENLDLNKGIYFIELNTIDWCEIVKCTIN
ncbi:leucine-rich repeat protein [Saccharicrinis sp. FJH62]|uniref:leucine-rich repeat protein n=1 Tax=Saccharicrinis sp. FJH62 TaxID=3344657 RepID=UPI0035D4F682